ncbi:MAG: hypothetical protein H0V49_07480 [Nocardioidaceae bacterium]|nr:hypothetical protein [Nocardioidaceae bacterium]
MSVLSMAAVLLLLRQLQPRFWFVDDKRNQYLPVARDIGRRLRDGEFPAIDPDLGTGGNFALDLQYGLYEPVHLLTAVFLSYVDNFALAGFLWAAAYLLIFALGTTCLTLRLGAAGPWAVAAGLSAATSGYVLYWLAPNWIPGLLSLAWLPWLWWAWSGRLSPLRCLAVAVFTYLVIAGGWPATWLMFAALAVGLLVEEMVLRDRGAPNRSWLAPLAIRSAAVVAGVIPAAITVLPLLRAADYTARNDEIRNSNFLVPNLADLLAFASPTLHGEITGFWGSTIMSPIYFAAWFGLPVLWLVAWSRQRVKVRGVISGALACLIMAVLTQAPSDLGPLRNPFRGLAGFQFFLIVTVVMLACAGALVVNRHRVVGLAASVLALGWLTWARDPLDSNGLTGVLIVAALATALVVAARIAASAGGLVAWVGTGVAAVVAFQLNPVDVDPLRPVTDTGGNVSITEADWPVFASFPRTEPVVMQRWFADGVGRGFERLSADVRLAPGYSSIRQVGFEERFCIKSSHGYTCDAAARRLLEAEPRTDRPWIDLLGYRTVVLAGEKRQRLWKRAAGPEWERVDKGTDFFKYQRREVPVVAGRITHVEGEAEIRELEVSNGTQSYEVTSSPGAVLVFRDLYWPGYAATLDGEPLKVSSLSGTLLTVELPPGATGELTVHYAPVTGGELAGLTAGGIGVAGVSMVMAWIWRRRFTTDLSETETARAVPASDKSVGVDGDRDEGEPDEGKTLQNPI